jgi:hypothetical protein
VSLPEEEVTRKVTDLTALVRRKPKVREMKPEERDVDYRTSVSYARVLV